MIEEEIMLASKILIRKLITYDACRKTCKQLNLEAGLAIAFITNVIFHRILYTCAE